MCVLADHGWLVSFPVGAVLDRASRKLTYTVIGGLEGLANSLTPVAPLTLIC